MKGMTRLEIVTLAREGRYEEIPSEYNIKWVFNNKPHKVFECEVPGENITFTRNKIPAPFKVLISCEYTPKIPTYNADWYNIEESGDVYLNTSLELKTLKFIYNLEKTDIEPFFEWIRKHSKAIAGRCNIKKEELTFDMKATLPDKVIEIFNVTLKDIDFEDLENLTGLATFNLTCEHFKIEL